MHIYEKWPLTNNLMENFIRKIGAIIWRKTLQPHVLFDFFKNFECQSIAIWLGLRVYEFMSFSRVLSH